MEEVDVAVPEDEHDDGLDCVGLEVDGGVGRVVQGDPVELALVHVRHLGRAG